MEGAVSKPDTQPCAGAAKMGAFVAIEMQSDIACES